MANFGLGCVIQQLTDLHLSAKIPKNEEGIFNLTWNGEGN
jgi:hypothetical protein